MNLSRSNSMLAAMLAAGGLLSGTPTGSVVKSVWLDGEPAQIALETRTGTPFDEAVVNRDVRKLYATGRFSDVRVEIEEDGSGKRILFFTVEAPRRHLRTLRTEPGHFRFKAEIPVGTPVDPARARLIANEFRKQLAGLGYDRVVVTPEIEPIGSSKADLVLRVAAGDRVQVAGIQLAGATGLDRKQALGALRDVNPRRILPGVPGLWKGWIHHPDYDPRAVDRAVARLRSLYFSNGYFDAIVRQDNTGIAAGKATVGFYIQPGERYRVNTWEVNGVPRPVGRDFSARELCRCLFDSRRQAEKEGIAEYQARLAIKPSPDATVALVANIARGQPYRIRRIEFVGNRRFRDSTIRANLLLRESDMLDFTLLRRSIDRLNRSSLFEPSDESNVDVVFDAARGVADIRFRLKERKFGSWLLSGPVGPMSVAGPLQFAIAARLPAWARGPLELSSWYASFSAIGYSTRKVRPIFALQRPFLPGHPWSSGLTIAPQLGWRGMLLNYGSVQFRERILTDWLGGTDSSGAGLPVIIERPDGEAAMLCEPPAPRWKRVRKGAMLALQIMPAFL